MNSIHLLIRSRNLRGRFFNVFHLQLHFIQLLKLVVMSMYIFSNHVRLLMFSVLSILYCLSSSAQEYRFPDENQKSGRTSLEITAVTNNEKEDPSIETGIISPLFYCPGKPVQVPFTATGSFTNTTVFTAQLSDASGSFTNAVNIGTVTGTGATTISGLLPATVGAGTGYRIRVIADDPEVLGSDNVSNIYIMGAPVMPASIESSYCNYNFLNTLGIIRIYQGQPVTGWSGPGVSSFTQFGIEFPSFQSYTDYYYSFNAFTAGVGVHNITLTNVSGCSTTKTITVKQVPFFTVTPPVGCSLPIDLTSTVSSTVMPNGTVLKYFLNGKEVTNPEAITEGGTYTITATSPEGCTYQQNINIALPVLPANLLDSYCTSTSSVSLGTIRIYNGQPYYGWFGDGISYVTAPGIDFNTFTGYIDYIYNFSPSTAGVGIHAVKLTNTTGCYSTRKITVNASPSLTIIPPSPVCAPQTTNLTTVVSNSSILPAGTELKYFLNGVEVIRPDSIFQSGNYTIRATTVEGCTDEETVFISIYPAPVLPAVLQDSYCNVSSIVSLGSIRIYQNQQFYGWTGPGISYQTFTGIDFNNFQTYTEYYYTFTPFSAGPGVHTLTLKNAAGCSTTKTVTVKQSPVFTVTPPTGCSTPFDLTSTVSSTVMPAGTVFEYFLNGQEIANPGAITEGGNYLIKATSPEGCIYQQTINIPLPAMPAALDYTYCTSASEFLGIIRIYEGEPFYGWSGTGISYNTVQGIDLLSFKVYTDYYYSFSPFAAGPGTHTLTLTNASGCASTRSIVVNQAPSLVITQPVSVCAPQTIDLTSAVSSTSILPDGTEIKYFLNGAEVSNPTALSQGGNYTIRATTAEGCTDEETVFVFIQPLPVMSATLLNNYCNSFTSVFLGTIRIYTGQTFYGWTGPGISTIASGGFDFGTFNTYVDYMYFFSPSTAGVGTHTLTLANAFGCTVSRSVKVYQSPHLVTITPASVCAPQTVDLTTAVSSSSVLPAGTEIKYYLNGVEVSNPQVVSASGVYTIIVTTPDGCSDQENVFVSIRPAPVMPSGLLDSYCNSITGVFLGTIRINGNQPFYGWSGPGISFTYTVGFDFGTFNTFTDYTYIFSPSSAGTGVHTLTLTNASACSTTKAITINQAPSLEIIPPPSVCAPQTINLTDAVGDNSVLPDGTVITYYLNGVEITNPEALSVSGVYTVIATTTEGCTDQETVTVSIRPAPVMPAILETNYCNSTVNVSLGTIRIYTGQPFYGWSGPGISSFNVIGFDFGVFNTYTDYIYSFSPSSAGPGTHTLTLTNAAQCSTSRTVTVGSKVTIQQCLQNISVSNDRGICGAVVNFEAPAYTGGCGAVNLVQTSGLPSGSVFPVGTTSVTWTATDAAGNNASCTLSVTVTDNEDPVLDNVPANLVVQNSSGTCGIVVQWNLPGATDNCPGVNLTSSQNPGDYFQIGVTTVTYTATDAAGRTTTRSFTITVKDKDAPVLNCAPTIERFNEPGTCNAHVQLIQPTASDCSAFTLTATRSDGQPLNATYPVGTTTITWTGIDSEGNRSECTQMVIVKDNELPQITVAGSQFFCYSANGYTIPAPVVNDNCGISSISYSISGATIRTGIGLDAGSSFQPGNSFVTWTVTDGAGNTKTAAITVTVNPPLLVSIPDVWVPGGAQPNTIYSGYGPATLSLTSVTTGGTPGYTFSWTKNSDPAIIGTSSGLVVSGPGNYKLTVTDSKGCKTEFIKSIYLVDIRCGKNGEKVLLCMIPQGNPSAAHEICVSPNAVKAHIQNGAYLGPCMQSITKQPVTEPTVIEVSAYPNPAEHEFQLQVRSANIKETMYLFVYNNLGKLIESRVIIPNSLVKIGSLYQPGIYFAEVMQGKQKESIKLVKEGRF